MENEVTPAEEPKAPEADAPKVETIGDALQTGEPEVPDKEQETVPLAQFLELKKDNKELRKSLKNIEQRLTDGETPKDVASDLQALADEHNIDPAFLKKFAKNIEDKARKDIEEKIDERLAPINASQRQAHIDKQFEIHYAAAMKDMPDYTGIVNPEVIKQLSMDPKNGKKTFAQLIEETYGNAISGKRTIETTKPGGGKEPETVDVERAQKDPEYYAEVMANPTLKKEYNKGLTERLSKTF